MFPFPEIFWQAIIGLLWHSVLLHLIVIFNFFEDRSRVEISDADDHSILDSIEIESSHVLFHRCDNITFFAFESESDVWRLGTISFLNVFFKGKDGWLRVDAKLGNSKVSEVVFKVDFDHCFIFYKGDVFFEI